jgi:hypothetical protein
MFASPGYQDNTVVVLFNRLWPGQGLASLILYLELRRRYLLLNALSKTLPESRYQANTV